MKYWLFKSEPSAFSIDNLKRVKTSLWDGVRNYQVRNLMRDQMQIGDKALFYHSSCKDVGVVGEMEIVKNAVPDPTQFDKNSEYYDPKFKPENPQWLAVTVKYVSTFSKLVSLAELRKNPALKNLIILRPGNRLSITEITKREYEKVVYLGYSK